jgi:hypothetical protein
VTVVCACCAVFHSEMQAKNRQYLVGSRLLVQCISGRQTLRRVIALTLFVVDEGGHATAMISAGALMISLLFSTEFLCEAMISSCLDLLNSSLNELAVFCKLTATAWQDMRLFSRNSVFCDLAFVQILGMSVCVFFCLTGGLGVLPLHPY